jgi:aspartate/methionine/tyrosine aminotransferase
MAQFVKLQSISLCANVSGQIATYLMVSPPAAGDASYDVYTRERDAILDSLKTRARILGEGVNQIDGMSVDIPQGAMYAFVKIQLPPLSEKHTAGCTSAEVASLNARRDEEYCMALLDETGICVVPGSGFGQLPGTLHFRTTFLPPQEEIEALVVKLKNFHRHYVNADAVAL